MNAFSRCFLVLSVFLLISLRLDSQTKFNFSIGFKMEDNPILIKNVNAFQDGEVFVCMFPEPVNVGRLIAEFSVDNEIDVYVNGVKQQSKISENDFNQKVVYTLKHRLTGHEQSFIVQVVIFTGLPIIRVETEKNRTIVDRVVYLNAAFDSYAGKLGSDLSYTGPVKIRGRGNTTWRFPKKPYKLKFSEKVGLLGMPPSDEWVLLANYIDYSLLRTSTAFFISRFLDMPYTVRSVPVELFVNGEHRGVYQLCEQVMVAPNRVPAGDKGFFLEIDSYVRVAERKAPFFTTDKLNEYSRSGEDLGSVFVYQKTASPTFADSTSIIDYIRKTEKVIYSENFAKPDSGYRSYIDVESFINWYLVNEVSLNNDAAFFSSVYFYKPIDGKLFIGPVWDYDMAFGLYELKHDNKWKIKNSPWIDRLFDDRYFVDKLKERWVYLYTNRQKILDFIDSSAEELKYSQSKNHAIWQSTYKSEQISDYSKAVKDLKDFIVNRMEWLNVAIMDL